MDPVPATASARLRQDLARHGRDAVAYQGLEPGLSAWCDPAGAVAYLDTGGAWIAAGGPHAAPADRAAVAQRFVDAARAAGRRASLFAVDDEPAWPGFDRVLLGEQPAWDPQQWDAIVRGHRSLREQLRRARAKGVRVRRVTPAEVAVGTPLRRQLDALVDTWLTGRAMEPMQFLVTLVPFAEPELHRYYVAERDGRAVAFAALVPVPARHGWLIEDLIRGDAVPNGTSELLIDLALRDLAADGFRYATTGLAPLAGAVPAWMRQLGRVGGALYDFEGLRRFKARFHPPRWDPVWLCYPAGEAAALHLLDALRGFAGGGLVGFGVRTVVKHPSALAWVLAVPLVPWTALLAIAAATGRAGWFGYGPGTLLAWAAFDGLLAVALWRAARRPRPRLLGAIAGAAGVDAALSLAHLAQGGFGSGWAVVARLLATAAPIVGCVGLVWARRQARRRARQRAAQAAAATASA
ncbi:MAG: phosphatidylglycerol lysyltransferase domain-containing protein [Kofleriaceae bacterium]